MFKNNQKVLLIVGCLLVPMILQAAYTSTMPKLKGGYDTLKVLIEFPTAALDQHLQDGLVEIEFFIEEDGSITKPHIVKQSHPFYNQAVIKAIQDVEFFPATSNNIPIRVLYRIPVYFKTDIQ